MTLKITNVKKNLSLSEHEYFLKNIDSYSYFQSPDWIRVLVSTFPNYQNTTHLFEFSDYSRILFPLMCIKKLKGLFFTYHSMPFNTYGGLLVSQHLSATAEYEEKIRLIQDYICHLQMMKLTITPNPLDEIRFSLTVPHSMIEMSTQILHLQNGYEWIWENRFDSKNRNQIRKARKSGLIIADNLENSGEQYWQIYQTTIAGRGGKRNLVYPRELFHQLAMSPTNVKYYFALWNEKPIAGIIVLYGRKTAMYWNSVNYPEAKILCANQFLLDYAIQQAVENKITSFDLGASRGLPTVKSFKSAFGPEEVSYIIVEWAKYRGK